jgi:hypothetical protein
MSKSINRRDFIKTSVAIGGLSFISYELPGCKTVGDNYLFTPKAYDIFYKFKTPGKIYNFSNAHLASLLKKNTARDFWILRSISSIFQGLVNRIEPRIYLNDSPSDVDWLAIYKNDGYPIEIVEVTNFEQLMEEFCPSLDGYIVIDPEMLDTINIAQTWGSLENWMVVTPELAPVAQKYGLKEQQDLGGRWQDRVNAYKWAFDNFFPKCSKHVAGDCCVDFPYHPSPGSPTIRDFLVANKAFTFDLSAALRQRKEYQLLDKIYASLEFPAGVWGWHDSRDHEHWAVDRAARKSVYTICAVGSPNLSLHGGIKPTEATYPKQKPSTRKNLVAEKNKVYIAWMMTDGDAQWVMERLQLGNWGSENRREFPMTWGFLPLVAEIAPAMYMHYIKNMNDNDYMVAGPSGAGYTYPHMYADPRQFLKYTKFYMQKCGLEIVNITNWNDYTNWQEVDLPDFNPMLFEELNHGIGYIRGMGESAFEPHYNFKDRPYIFCGEGIHRGDKDDVDTIRSFIEANPNRPLFIFSLINIAIKVDRIKKVIDSIKEYDIEYVRLDDFMHLIKSAYKQGLITEDLYPNRKGNEQILIKEAPAGWQGTRSSIQKLVPVIEASSEKKALEEMNSENAQLALGQKITDEDKADILAFALCENMFRLVKNVLNLQGIYVNLRKESIEKFIELYGNWAGIDAFKKLINMWQNWDQLSFKWAEIILIGKQFLKIYRQSDKLF